MLLDNWIKTMIYSVSYGNKNPDLKFLDGSTGQQLTYSLMQSPVVSINNISNAGQFCIACGTNDTPVTVEDYAWDNHISELTYSTTTHEVTQIDGRTKYRIYTTVFNNTESDIVVNEIGLIVGARYSLKALLAREVLDTPITVAANGGAQVFGIDIG